MLRRTKGFTLIELVIVIVILGLLAAAALPRFSDLSTDARVAALNGLTGSIRSAASIAKATQVAKGLASNLSVTLDGVVVGMQDGYPTESAIDDALGDYSGFALSASTAGGYADFTTRTDCYTRYTEASGNTAPTVVITSTGC